MQQGDSDDYEIEDEYDFSSMEALPRGRFAPERRAASNVALLAPEIAQAFPTDDAVNEALRLVLRLAELATHSRSE
jgi:hypothetical protein